MPQMGVSVSEGTVTRWLRNVGDTVSADESLLEISTDKVDTEVPSPGAGVLQEILVAEGETVAGRHRARSHRRGRSAAQPDARREPPAARRASPTPAAGLRARLRRRSRVDRREHETTRRCRQPGRSTRRQATAHAPSGTPFVSPVVARIAAEHGIDPRRSPGSGRDGRVTKKDMLAFVEARRARPAAPRAQAPAPADRAAVPRRGLPAAGACRRQQHRRRSTFAGPRAPRVRGPAACRASPHRAAADAARRTSDRSSRARASSR